MSVQFDLQFVLTADPQPAPEPDDTLGEDLRYAVLELERAQPDYARASTYYNGTQPEFFSSIRMRFVMGATGITFNFNFAALPVDAVAERLEIAGISVDDDSALELIRQEWESNLLDLYAPDIMLQACKYGDAYVFIWPNEDGQTLENGQPKIDIFYVSPRIMRLFYDDENELQKRYAIKRWLDPRTEYTFANLYYPDRIEKYMLPPQAHVSTGHGQQLWVKRVDPEDNGEWPLPNPFGEVPVFHFRNKYPYGRAEHANAYGPQDAIHKLVISHMASIDYNAFPQRWAIMDPAYDTSEMTAGDEGEFAFTLETGATSNIGIDPKSQLTADPASVWFMRGIKQYGEFKPADPSSFLDPFNDYIHAMAVVTSTPMHFLDPIVSNVSGESLRVIEAPFAKKVRKRQMSFGATWRDVWRFVLRLHGVENIPVQVNWVPAATVNDLATLQGQVIKNQLGVPERQLLEELGYTPEQLDAWNIQVPPIPRTFVTEAGESGSVGAEEL